MRRFLIIGIWIMVILAIGCSKAPVDPNDETNGNSENNDWGTVRVTVVDKNGVKLDSVKIFVNGEFKDLAPVIIDSLDYGIHTLRAQKAGYDIYSESITVDNNLLINKEIVLQNASLNTGQLFISVNVDSAKTTVTDNQDRIVEQSDDQEIYLSLESGGYFIRCEKPGYNLFLEAVQVVTDSIVVENIVLERQVNTGTPQVALSLPDSGYVDMPVLVSWESSNATSVDIDYIENPGLYGKREIRFQTKGYHFLNAIAQNEVGITSTRDSIYISELSTDQPEIDLSVTPAKIFVNQVATIKWSSRNATEVNVDYVTNPGLSGQWQERFYQSGPVVIRAFAYGAGGIVEARDTLIVQDRVDPPPTVSVHIEPDEVEVNQPVLIQWTSTGAREVDVDFVTNPGLSGQSEVLLSTVGTIVIRAHAYGDGGEAHAADTVHVKPAAIEPPQIELSVNPMHVGLDEQVVITWSSKNATAVDIDFVPNPGLSGQWKTSFSEEGEYIIRGKAYGANASVAMDMDTLVVTTMPPPELDFEIEPGSVKYGDPATLTWRSNGIRVVIDQGVGTRGPVGSEEYFAKHPGTKYFTAIAYGENGMTTIVTDSVTFIEVDDPILPVVSLTVIDSIKVGEPAVIEWRSWKADRVDVDYVPGAGLNGKAEIVFDSPGMREITAFAFNEYGQSEVMDTVVVVEEEVSPQIESIILPTTAAVCAFHQSIPRRVDDAASAEIGTAGYYRIVVGTWYNSGDSQKNESYYITVTNSNGETTPEDPNAGVYKVVPDEPGSPHTSERDAGIFYLPEGLNSINVMHYYLIADQYPQFVVDGPITSYESIHLLYFKLEFVHE